jgi:hypothetical protein
MWPVSAGVMERPMVLAPYCYAPKSLLFLNSIVFELCAVGLKPLLLLFLTIIHGTC